MQMTRVLIAAVLGLAGCAGEPLRLSVTATPSEMTTRVSVRSVMVADISLPDYANAAEIVRETEGGLIEVVPDLIWADIPENAMANAVVRNLSQITSASVAREPWPLSSFPDAELTIRVEQMLLQANDHLFMSGQFAIRRDEGPWAERIRPFEFTVPVLGVELSDLADAHATAWRQLAEQIADEL